VKPPVVPDANVLVPGFVSSGSASSRLIDLWRSSEIGLIVSAHLLGDVERAYAGSYYARRVSPEQVRRILEAPRVEATMTPLTISVTGVATQPKDDPILSTAVNNAAEYLATRDRQLLKIEHFQSVLILHPVDLLRLLEYNRSQYPPRRIDR